MQVIGQPSRAILASSVNSVRAGDWTAVRAILASNVNSVRVGDWTAVKGDTC